MRWQKNGEGELWNSSFRAISNLLLILYGGYVYCTGSEGVVDDEIANDLKTLGWEPVPY